MSNKIKLIVLIVLFIILLVLIKSIVNNETINILNRKQESNLVINENIITREISEEEKEKNSVLEVTEETFEKEVLNSNKIVCVDFYATWCGPCKILSPLVKQIAEENEDIKAVSIDIDNNTNLAEEYRIEYIPTLVIIKDGKEINRSIGVITKEEILELIEKN